MLDYEVYYYNVQWWADDCFISELHFDTEENAVEFIKTNRDKWSDYRLLKIQKAIIDF